MKNTYDIYPEQSNPGIEMQDVEKEDFVAETVKADGNEYLLLHFQHFPWTFDVRSKVVLGGGYCMGVSVSLDTFTN